MLCVLPGSFVFAPDAHKNLCAVPGLTCEVFMERFFEFLGSVFALFVGFVVGGLFLTVVNLFFPSFFNSL